MNDGNYLTGEKNVIHFKCTKCGEIMPMDTDIAYEVLGRKLYKGKNTFYAYCMCCESIMYPIEIFDNNK